MKKFLILFLTLIPYTTFAASPSTSCPAGFTTIEEEHLILANDACPTGYSTVKTATSCLVSSPAGSCIMYAPADTEYSDTSGTYKFTAACPLE